MSLNTIFYNGTHKIETAGRLPNKSEKERLWRDSEILRTDELVKLPDIPAEMKTGLETYRTELRDYPQQPDFPDGTRPSI